MKTRFTITLLLLAISLEVLLQDASAHSGDGSAINDNQLNAKEQLPIGGVAFLLDKPIPNLVEKFQAELKSSNL
ncbi:MAG: hypothetical protein EOM06_08925 [Sphingobacteriia bacterium]|nr:hypothetical protein [Sphingobacteriia bacterium]